MSKPLPNPTMVRLEDDLIGKLSKEQRRLGVRGIGTVIRRICHYYFDKTPKALDTEEKDSNGR